MKHILLLSAAAVLALAAPAAFAQGQPDFSKVQIKTTDLGHNTYELEGQGGNITVAVGTDGVIMVDGEFAPLHDKIKAAVDKVSGGKPIKYLINTHFHGDHTGGNGPFHRDGVTIVSDPNVAKRLAHGTVNLMNGAKTPAVEKDAVPTKLYKEDEGLMLSVGGRTAAIHYMPHAHTDGDSYVYFAAANVISTGDIVSLGDRYPNIDYSNGGSINGIIKAVDTYIKLGNDQTKYVPGHGPLASRTDLEHYRDMLVDARARVEKLAKEGKTEDQIVAANPLSDISAKLHVNDMGSANMVKLIYRSMKTKV
jgi:glyoxylase-like metal-dependent hydrolase (beta-lactamase superfamily II)